MMQRILAVFIFVLLPSGVLAQAGPGSLSPDGPPLQPVGPPPPHAVALWPPEARIEQLIELHDEELRQMLRPYPGLGTVRSVRIADYSLPGPPAPPEGVLEFYSRTLREPAWHLFFRNVGGPGTARAAYRGPGGFISVLARPGGAIVTHIEGEVELSAVPTLERAIRETVAGREHTPMEARDKVEAALRLRREGKTEEAAAGLRAVIAKFPMADIAHFNLARLLAERGQFEEAGQHFRRAVSLAPLNTVFRADYARFLADRGDLENARYELEQSVTIDPWSPQPHAALGRLFENGGLLKEAEKYYRRVVELVGNSPEAYVDLGRVLEKQGRKKDALAAYQDALKLKSNFPPAREAVRRLE